MPPLRRSPGGGISELKAKVGSRTLRIHPTDPLQLRPMAAELDACGLIGLSATTLDTEAGAAVVPVRSDEQLTAIVATLAARGFGLADITTRLPGLDEVFLSITGQKAGGPQDAAPVHQEIAV